MNHTMEYKGYTGSVEFSEEDTLFYGRVMGIRMSVGTVLADNLTLSE